MWKLQNFSEHLDFTWNLSDSWRKKEHVKKCDFVFREIDFNVFQVYCNYGSNASNKLQFNNEVRFWWNLSRKYLSGFLANDLGYKGQINRNALWGYSWIYRYVTLSKFLLFRFYVKSILADSSQYWTLVWKIVDFVNSNFYNFWDRKLISRKI